MGTLLITGGGGFVLSHLARRWGEADPANKVLVLDAAPLDEAARDFFAPLGQRLVFIQGDAGAQKTWDGLGAHKDEITHIVQGAAVTSIKRHLLAGGLPAVTPILETNIMGPVRALAFAATAPKLKRFINVSSGSVYANEGNELPHQPLPEDGSVKPEGYYAASKLIGEMLTTQAQSVTGLPALSVRFSSVYGPLDRHTPARDVDCAPKQILNAYKQSRVLKVSGLAAMGDYIHAGEVADALLALLTCPQPRHPVYNIAQGEFTTLSELLALAQELLPDFRFVDSAAEDADLKGEPHLTKGRWGAYDISRITADTGWRPRPLKDALADYATWLKDHAA